MSLLIGTINSFGYDLTGNAPEGFLPCNGAAVSRTTYAELFKAIGTTWGKGDGTTTFNVPDLRGMFLRGVDDGAGKDPDAARRMPANTVGSFQRYATSLPTGGTAITTSLAGKHNHYVNHLPTDSSWYEIAGSHYAEWNNGGTQTSSDGLHAHTISSGGDSETRPVNLYVDYAIYSGS
jgi:microcystin-dependent protein